MSCLVLYYYLLVLIRIENCCGYVLATLREHDASYLSRFRAMYERWPFFGALMDNMQMAMAKADMDIAHMYTSLSTAPKTAVPIFEKIRAEYRRTVEQITAICDIDELLDNTHALQLSLNRRNPYLDPLNSIQIMLLKQYRASTGNSEHEASTLNALLRSINAIAAGMRNTGYTQILQWSGHRNRKQ